MPAPEAPSARSVPLRNVADTSDDDPEFEEVGSDIALRRRAAIRRQNSEVYVPDTVSEQLQLTQASLDSQSQILDITPNSTSLRPLGSAPTRPNSSAGSSLLAALRAPVRELEVVPDSLQEEEEGEEDDEEEFRIPPMPSLDDDLPTLGSSCSLTAPVARTGPAMTSTPIEASPPIVPAPRRRPVIHSSQQPSTSTNRAAARNATARPPPAAAQAAEVAARPAPAPAPAAEVAARPAPAPARSLSAAGRATVRNLANNNANNRAAPTAAPAAPRRRK